jgi:glutamate synthase (ferredoxin)
MVEILEKAVANAGQKLLGWRDVPVNNEKLGQTAKDAEPVMRQVFIGRGTKAESEDAFERRLFLIRKVAGHAISGSDFSQKSSFYIPSLSCRTLLYKGMLIADQIESYYPDLLDPLMDSALALVHQRFSTNTFPSWSLAHPFRYLAHNGEINTLRGNVNWMRAREALFQTEYFTPEEVKQILPVVNERGSDSAILDQALEMLVMCGRSLPHAMMMLIPEAWSGHESMSQEKKDFYEFHSCLMEPWDGPASVAFTDGQVIGAVLDRNGLRPSRYYVTSDDRVIMASEVGVLPELPPEMVVQKGRLQPGKMFLIDMREGRIVDDAELKTKIATAKPYGKWLKENLVALSDLPEAPHVPEPDHDTVFQRQQAFGYTTEDLKIILPPLAAGEEAIGSMGTDTPLVVLQATLRAGHQPAAGFDPRGIDHVGRDHDRPGREYPESRARVLPHDRSALAGFGQRRAGETAPHLRQRLQEPDAADDLQGQGWRRGPAQGRGRPVRKVRPGDQRRLQDHHTFRPRS